MSPQPSKSTLFPYTTLFRSELDTVVQCLELGADDYLTKPYELSILRARIGASIERKQLRDSQVSHRSEEHTSELQSRQYLVCRLLLEKKKLHLVSSSPAKDK